MPPGHLPGKAFRHVHPGRDPRAELQHAERQCLSDDQETPPGSSGGAGGHHWGEEYLGLPAEAGAPMTLIHIRARKTK